jgi:single-strand DNA-binding protein
MINKATLLGRIGKKEIKNTKNNEEMTLISVATNRKWIDSKGEVNNKTTWHNIVFFSKLAGIVKKYAQVGSLVYIEGEINNKKIESGEREGEYIYSVTGEKIQFIPSSKNESKENDKKEDNLLEDDLIPF